MKAYALIVAGGNGLRLGTETPKQFLKLAGKEVLTYSLLAFSRCAQIDGIIVCAQAQWASVVRRICQRHEVEKLICVATAGSDRRASVKSGLDALVARGLEKNSIVLVHDAARPFLTQEVILRNIEAAKRFGACNTGIPATDTPVLSEDGDTICAMPPRRQVYLSQTPQSFQTQLLLRAHAQVPEDSANLTDDCALVHACGHTVKLVQGSPALFKITRAQDFALARAVLEEEK